MNFTAALKSIVRNQGAARATLVVTIVTVLVSLLITELILIAESGWDHPLTWQQFVLPTVVPLIVAPPGAYLTLGLAEKLIESEDTNRRLVNDLQSALDDIRNLSGLLPICAGCKDIRDDDGDWHTIEHYVAERSDATFSHGLCPKCAKTYFSPEDLEASR